MSQFDGKYHDPKTSPGSANGHTRQNVKTDDEKEQQALAVSVRKRAYELLSTMSIVDITQFIAEMEARMKKRH